MGYIDPKEITELGETLIKKAILAALADAHAKNTEYLTNREISERAGISGYIGDWGIARVLAHKLKKDRKIENRKDYVIPVPQGDQWKLAKPSVK